MWNGDGHSRYNGGSHQSQINSTSNGEDRVRNLSAPRAPAEGNHEQLDAMAALSTLAAAGAGVGYGGVAVAAASALMGNSSATGSGSALHPPGYVHQLSHQRPHQYPEKPSGGASDRYRQPDHHHARAAMHRSHSNSSASAYHHDSSDELSPSYNTGTASSVYPFGEEVHRQRKDRLYQSSMHEDGASLDRSSSSYAAALSTSGYARPPEGFGMPRRPPSGDPNEDRVPGNGHGYPPYDHHYPRQNRTSGGLHSSSSHSLEEEAHRHPSSNRSAQNGNEGYVYASSFPAVEGYLQGYAGHPEQRSRSASHDETQHRDVVRNAKVLRTDMDEEDEHENSEDEEDGEGKDDLESNQTDSQPPVQRINPVPRGKPEATAKAFSLAEVKAVKAKKEDRGHKKNSATTTTPPPPPPNASNKKKSTSSSKKQAPDSSTAKGNKSPKRSNSRKRLSLPLTVASAPSPLLSIPARSELLLGEVAPSISDGEFQSLEQLMTQFCRVPLLAEFSRPVALLHPEVCN
jgi:hypothetical protein